MRHENIVRVLAFSEGTRERPPCLVMERMEESISSFLKVVRVPPPVRGRLEIIKDICQVSTVRPPPPPLLSFRPSKTVLFASSDFRSKNRRSERQLKFHIFGYFVERGPPFLDEGVMAVLSQ